MIPSLHNIARIALLLFLLLPGAYAQQYPDFQITTAGATDPGYYFLCPIRVGANPSNIGNYHTIMDGSGLVVYYRRFPANMNTGDFKMQASGLISYYAKARFYITDSTFTIVDSAYCQNGVLQDAHDMQLLPNGHYLLLGNENITTDLSAYPWFGNNGSPGSSGATVSSGIIQELDAAKNVVFEWHAADHYDFADVDETYLNDPNNVDWTHLNAVEVDYDGNLLLSVRHFNEITKIDRNTGQIIWRLGGKKNQFSFPNDPAGFIAQHDARRIANGNITLFDNGRNGMTPHPAAAKEYLLDENALSAELVWKYEEGADIISRAMGNVVRREDGKTLIDYGMLNKGNTLFNVVSPDGEKYFEVQFADTLVSYRSFYYASLPWSLNRPVIQCFESDGQYFLDAGEGHAIYRWSTGANTRVIPVNQAGQYYVYVPKGEGFVSSEIFEVTDPGNPCLLTDVKDVMPGDFFVRPNPVSDRLTLVFPEGSSASAKVRLSDLTGKTMLSGIYDAPGGVLNLDLATLPPGVYFLYTNGRSQKVIKL